MKDDSIGNLLYDMYGDDSIVSNEKGDLFVRLGEKDYYTTIAGTKGDLLYRQYGESIVLRNSDGIAYARVADGDWYISSLPRIQATLSTSAAPPAPEQQSVTVEDRLSGAASKSIFSKIAVLTSKYSSDVIEPQYILDPQNPAFVEDERGDRDSTWGISEDGMLYEGNAAGIPNSREIQKLEDRCKVYESFVQVSSKDEDYMFGYKLNTYYASDEVSDRQTARETSPELEDKDVLNNVDYATVVALKRAYVQYASEGRRDAMDACLRAIEEIRRKPEYRDLYSSKDSSGLAVSGYSYFSNSDTARVYSIHAHVITEENRMAHDETVANVGGALLGYKLPVQYAALLSAMIIGATSPQGQSPALTDVALAALGLQQGVSGKFFTLVGLVVAQNNRSVKVGDIEVVISMLNKNQVGTPQITNSQYLFSNNVELKNEQYWPSIAVPRVR